jgi:hypothetical protein
MNYKKQNQPPSRVALAAILMRACSLSPQPNRLRKVPSMRSTRHGMMWLASICTIILIALPVAAQPGAACKLIAGEIVALQSQRKSLEAERQSIINAMDKKGPDGRFPSAEQKAALAAEAKALAADIAALAAKIAQKNEKLDQCLALASTSGGEAFKMQGGLTLTASQVASAAKACNSTVAPPVIPIQLPSKAQSPAPAKSWFAASSCTTGNPSDAQIAVSSSRVLVTFEDSMAWYDKNGNKQGELTNFALFSSLLKQMAPAAGRAGQNGGPEADCYWLQKTLTCARTQSDMRVIYDEYRKRFWVVDGAGIYTSDWVTVIEDGQPVVKRDPNKARGIFLLAVSQSEDPKDGWYLYWWDAVAHWGKTDDKIYQPGDGGDYPSLGIDPEAFHITNSVGGKYYHVAFFKAQQAIQGTASDGWHFYDLQNPDGTSTSLIQPVVHHGATGRAYYVSRYISQTDLVANSLGNRLLVWALTDPFTAARQISRVEVRLVDSAGHDVPYNQPSDAPQKDAATTIAMTNLDTNILKAVYRNGLLHIVGNDAEDWFNPEKPISSIRMVRLFVLGYPNIQTQGEPSYLNRRFGKNGPDDNPQDRMYYGWPALEVNKKGDMAIVYSRSGITIYPQVRYSTYHTGEPDIRSSRLLQPGFGPVSPSCVPTNDKPCRARWGDTAGAAVDPEDDTGIWVAQQYANAKGSWDIWVGKVFGK